MYQTYSLSFTHHSLPLVVLVRPQTSGGSVTANVRLAAFPRNGFFDWRLVEVSPSMDAVSEDCEDDGGDDGRSASASASASVSAGGWTVVSAQALVAEPGKATGRFIVQPRGLHEELLHEVVVDMQVCPTCMQV
jgi:hypothetical protein